MKKRFAVLLLTLAAWRPGTSVGAVPEGCAGITLQLRVGDTLGALFGRNWEKVWRCNQTVLIRGGRPLLSPDLVAAGATLQVPSGVRLSPLAESRVREWEERHGRIGHRLDALAGRPGIGSDAGIRELRLMLNDPRHYAGDLDYLERQVGYLEGLARAPVPTGKAVWRWVAGLVGVLLTLTALYTLRKRHNGDLAVRELRAVERVSAVCRDAGLRIST